MQIQPLRVSVSKQDMVEGCAGGGDATQLLGCSERVGYRARPPGGINTWCHIGL